MPSADEIAVLVENLDATVATIGNVDASHRTADRNIVRIIEIARRRSFVTPGLDEPAILREFEDAGIVRGIATVAVGNKDIAICADRHASRPIEDICALTADTHLPKHHQNLTVLVELENFLSKNGASGVAR